MFEDILGNDPVDELEVHLMCCEECENASYILTKYPGTKVLCQVTGDHMGYDEWCEKWEERSRVKPH